MPQHDERLSQWILAWIASRRSIFAGRIPAPNWTLGFLKSWRQLVSGWQIQGAERVSDMAERGELMNTQHGWRMLGITAVIGLIYKDMMMIKS
jgi:hypothetical protein